MKMPFYWRIVSVFFLMSLLQAFSQESGKELSLPDYIAELDRLAAAVKEHQKRPDVLREWIQNAPIQGTMRNGGRSYQLHYEWLSAGLAALLEKRSEEACRSMLSRIALLKADAQAMQHPAPDMSSNRGALNGILSRPEFQDVHGPTKLEKLRRKVMVWLNRLLRGTAGHSSFPSISAKAVWTLAIIAAVVLALWIFKTLQLQAKKETKVLQDAAPPISAKPWMVWLADAQAAAAKQCWRDAVHLSYWAGISFLESRGLWNPDRARTPREYLRLLPFSSEHRDTLSALTGIFEPIWYGSLEAGPETFSESLRHLETLGCHTT